VDIDTLRSFLRMAELGSLTHAAEELYLSPSSLASRIKRLEEELGQELFILRGRNLYLSPSGLVFVPYAERICKLADEIHQETDQKGKGMSGIFSIAVSSIIATYVLPDILKSFKSVYPKVELEIHVCPSFMIKDYLLRGTVDLGIAQSNKRHENLAYKNWFQDEDILVVSNQHPWAELKKIDVANLSNHPLLVFSRQSTIWRRRKEWIEKHGKSLWVGMELIHTETVKEILLNNYGYAFLPYLTVQEELKDGSLKEIEVNDSPSWERNTWFVTPQKEIASEKSEVFVKYCLEQQINVSRNKSGCRVGV
jgi:DNA-binding transcriptional LysR family regulator